MAIRHDFCCQVCEERVPDVVCSTGDVDASAPTHCGKPMVIDWMVLAHSVQEFSAFVTRNIHPEGKPLLVRNRGDLQRYYQQYGVVHMDDPNLVAEGGEIVRKNKWKPSAFIDMGGRR